jgi:hypothetical protein
MLAHSAGAHQASLPATGLTRTIVSAAQLTSVNLTHPGLPGDLTHPDLPGDLTHPGRPGDLTHATLARTRAHAGLMTAWPTSPGDLALNAVLPARMLPSCSRSGPIRITGLSLG